MHGDVIGERQMCPRQKQTFVFSLSRIAYQDIARFTCL